MSILNAIGEGSLNELLARRLNTPGGATAPGVAPELFPNVTLENDRPEWGYIKNEQYGSVARRITAVAGEIGYLWVSNPFAPNLMTIQRVAIDCSVYCLIGTGVYPGFSAGSTIGNGVNRDTRFPTSNQVVFEAGTGAVGPAYLRVISRQLPGTDFTEPIVLGPNNNHGLIVQCSAINTLVTVNVHYRIRGAQPGELR